MSLQSLWNSIRESPSFTPAHFAIPMANVENPKGLGVQFKKDQHYFIVRINEMYLTYKRRWAREFEPVVFSTAEFNYDGVKITQPYLLSPNMLQSPFKNLPDGMLFKNITVAGLHPFKGGTFSISIILGRVQVNNYLRRILKFLETTSNAFPSGFSSVLSTYTKLANMVVDGMEELFESSDLEPIIGFKREFVAAVQDDFATGHYVLLNSNAGGYDQSKFFIKEKSLYYGDTLESAEPFRGDDFVLYSFESTETRDDTETLPFYAQFQELQRQVSMLSEITTEDKKKLSGFLFALNDAVWMSPDLVESQKEELTQNFREKIKLMIGSRQALSGSKTKVNQEIESWEDKRSQTGLDILNLDF